MSFVFIEDGYTRRARINAVAGLHGRLDFAFRPMLPRDCEDLEARITTLMNRGDNKGASNLVASVLENHITEWDVRLRDKSVAKISADSLARLMPGLFTKMKLIVQGAKATDTREDWSAEEWQEYAETGGSIGLESSRKNS